MPSIEIQDGAAWVLIIKEQEGVRVQMHADEVSAIGLLHYGLIYIERLLERTFDRRARQVSEAEIEAMAKAAVDTIFGSDAGEKGACDA